MSKLPCDNKNRSRETKWHNQIEYDLIKQGSYKFLSLSRETKNQSILFAKVLIKWKFEKKVQEKQPHLDKVSFTHIYISQEFALFLLFFLVTCTLVLTSITFVNNVYLQTKRNIISEMLEIILKMVMYLMVLYRNEILCKKSCYNLISHMKFMVSPPKMRTIFLCIYLQSIYNDV